MRYKIADLIEGSQWNRQVIFNIFHPSLANSISKLHIPLSPEDDKWV